MTAPHFTAAFRADLASLLQWRRDVRQFRPDPLPEAITEQLLNLASHAPSVGNSQPTRFVLVRSPRMRQALVDHVTVQNNAAASAYAAGARARYDRLKLHGLATCPLVIAVFSVADPAEGHGLGRQTMPETLAYSTVCAIHTLWLAARAHGIGLGWVSIVQPDAMGPLLDVPRAWRFIALLCLGYPEADASLPLLHSNGWQHRLPPETLHLER